MCKQYTKVMCSNKSIKQDVVDRFEGFPCKGRQKFKKWSVRQRKYADRVFVRYQQGAKL